MTRRTAVVAGVGLASVVGAVALAAYGFARENEEVSAADRARSIVVTRDHRLGPPSCGVRSVASLVLDFVAAFNRGDDERLSRFFSPDTFHWYSVEGGPGERSITSSPYDITTLDTYFSARHERGERLRLIEIKVADARIRSEVQGERIPPTPAAGIEFVVGRRARDFGEEDEVRQGGKALLDCRRRAIFYWSMGPDAAPRRPLCPLPASRIINAVIACTR